MKKKLNLQHLKRIYFVGIGGIAMSAAAGIAKGKGFAVSGSDSAEVYAPAKDVIDELDIPYHVGYDKKHIEEAKADLYILSAGEGLENSEVAYIVEKNLPHHSFSELLYELTKSELRIVVTGTHGKSTTAGLLGHLLKNLDDSSFMTGAVLKNYDSNFYVGDGHYWVFEGDEYKSEYDDPKPKFHYYKPDILVLTNLEYDHPDLFESFEALEEEFRLLIADMPEDGLVVYNADSQPLASLIRESEVSSISFGIENDADFKIDPDDIYFSDKYSEFKVQNKFSKDVVQSLLGVTEDYKTQLPGRLNVYNSLAAIATLRALGFQYSQIALDLLTFTGAKRRFEVIGEKNERIIVDDYAHHPTEVKQTLLGAKERYPNHRIWAVFEPHTFSRTRAVLKDLAECFTPADQVLISKIYPAREKVKPGNITSEQVIEEVKKYQPNARLVQNKDEALKILSQETKDGDIIIVMAVGSFNRLAYDLKEVL